MAASQPSITLQVQCVKLVEAIWGLKTCLGCYGKIRCVQNVCAADRLKRLQPFLRYFLNLADAYGLEGQQATETALSNYEDLFNLIKKLSECMESTKEQILLEFFGASASLSQATLDEQGRAMRLAVRILLMIECSRGLRSLDELESGNFQAPWESHETLAEFLSKRLPQGDHPLFASGDSQIAREA